MGLMDGSGGMRNAVLFTYTIANNYRAYRSHPSQIGPSGPTCLSPLMLILATLAVFESKSDLDEAIRRVYNNLLTPLQFVVITAAIDFIPLAFGFFSRLRLNKFQRVLFWLIAISFAADLCLVYLSYNRLPNLALVTLYSLLDLAFFCYIFSLWQGDRFFGKALISLGYLFVPVSIVLWLTLDDLLSLNKWVNIFESLLFVTLALHTIGGLSRYKTVLRPQREPRFWISFGALLYFAGAGGVYLSLDQGWPQLGVLHLSLNLIANLFYSVALMLPGRMADRTRSEYVGITHRSE